MSNELQKKQKTWDDFVNEVRPQFVAIAEREKLVQWQTESEFALQAIRGNDALSKCNPLTVQSAIINVAAVGLTLNKADGYAYLIPRKGECTLTISFKGLIYIATESGGISWVRAEIVKENDTFNYKGVSEAPEHIMQPFGERGKIVGVYCVAKTPAGDFLTDIMDLAEINKIRDCAMTKNVWDKYFGEMAKKAIIKRASKQWPRTDKSSRLNKAIEVINDVEGFDPDYTIYSKEQKEFFDQLIEKEDAYGYIMFKMDMEVDVISALFNSFEKGQKTKQKEKCRVLSTKGFEILEELKMKADEFCLGNDAFGLAEVIEDLTPKGKVLWWKEATNEIQKIATDLMVDK